MLHDWFADMNDLQIGMMLFCMLVLGGVIGSWGRWR